MELVKYLTEQGADVNPKNITESTPLHIAVESGSLEIVKQLVEHGADVNHKNIRKFTPLHTAVISDSPEIVKYLIEHNADVNCENDEKGTPLDIAAKMKSLKMVEYLFENSGKVTRNDDGTWNDILCSACEEGVSSVVEYLLQRKLIKDINTSLDSDWSPLHTACYYGHTAIVQILLKHNVDVRKEEKLECGNDEIISILDVELKKSVKHREKIQLLKQKEKGELVQVRLG